MSRVWWICLVVILGATAGCAKFQHELNYANATGAIPDGSPVNLLQWGSGNPWDKSGK